MYIYLWLAFVLVFHAPFKEVSLKSSQFFLQAISLNQHTTFFLPLFASNNGTKSGPLLHSEEPGTQYTCGNEIDMFVGPLEESFSLNNFRGITEDKFLPEIGALIIILKPGLLSMK